MSTELSTELEIKSFQELMTFSDRVSKSSMIPKDYIGKPENILVAVMMGAELGLKPFQAMQNIAVINGRPSIWGDAVLGLIQAHPECEYVEEEDLAVIKKQGSATCNIKRKGHPLVTNTFTVDMAKEAGLLNKQGPWAQYMPRMLKMRARGFSARDSFADVLKGINIAEEAQDIPPEKDITPPVDRLNDLVKENEKTIIQVYDATKVNKKEAEINKDSITENKNEQPEEVSNTLEAIKIAKDQKELMQHMKGLANFIPEHRATITLAFNEKSQQLKEEAKKAKETQDFVNDMDKTQTL